MAITSDERPFLVKLIRNFDTVYETIRLFNNFVIRVWRPDSRKRSQYK